MASRCVDNSREAAAVDESAPMAPRQPLDPVLRDQAFHGLGRGRLRGADLLTPFHGTRVVRGGPLDPTGRPPQEALLINCRILLQCTPSAMLGGLTAARIWPLPLPAPAQGEPYHLITLDRDRAPRRRGVVSRSITDGDVRIVERAGLRTIDVGSLFCHLALLLSLPDLVAVGDAIVLTPRFDPGDRPYLTLPALHERVGWYRGRGKRRAVEALSLVRPGAESRPETLVRLALAQAGLPEPTPNADIFDGAGRFLARGDLVYERWRVLVEYDGDHHRSDADVFDRDIRRLERLRDAGWSVVRLTKRSFFADREDCVRRVRSTLLAAGWRPA